MGAIPTQRETAFRASAAPAHAVEASAAGSAECARARVSLLGSSLAPGAARAMARAALADWSALGLPGTEQLTEHLAADALVVVSELVTNAVVHAGTDVEVSLRMEETGTLVVEATDQHPSRAPRSTDAEMPHDPAEYGRGLRLVAALAEAWGITYRPGIKTVWARLSAAGADADGAGQTETYAGGRGARRTPGADSAAGAVSEDAGAAETGKAAQAGQCGQVDGGDALGHVAHGAHDAHDAGGGSGAPHGPDDAGAGQAVGPDADTGQGAGPYAGGEGRAVGPYAGADQGVGPDADAGSGRGECSGRSGPADWRDPWDGAVGTARRGVRDREWLGRGALSFLAEASDLLAGQLDEDLVASLTGQLIVPRLADWCGVWLEDESLGRGAWSDDTGAAVGARLARVWHAGEGQLDELRAALEKDPPRPRDPWRSGPVGHPWPGGALGPDGTHGTALAYRLVAGGRPLGTLVIGRADSPGAPGSPGFPDEITGLVEDLSRRVALAIGAARQYARQATISAVLQRGLLPGAVAEIPGVRSALVYEPRDKGGPSGDFYDLFPAGDGRWCFAVGDVQGKGPEAAVVIGLARPWLRLLAREQYGVPDVLDRLNQLLLDDATEAADAAARALVAAGGPPVAPGDGPQTRFLSLLYGELVPFDGGVRCTLASAGHPLPLLLGPDGTVSAVACPQTLLGVVEDATYVSETFELRSGDTLLCVTDGITERRSGSRQFDDGDGLAAALAGCAGLDAELVAERIRRLVHEFGPRPPEDDLALLVLQAE
ncbi:SpoIIE family protein phosphatase [Streptomyces sp. AD681]|uniref:SpoIIE family protein phosphatase n=1 Tax=Streptomyces sp. AD681 TaxID=3019069 RepID=UPI0022F1B455|nr:SpoIIE family protein phosphatase [Streptomyces sp. AD681]MDA5144598.1 SpoIIE family protein phosphatase [Streptomyces sp. AD681]